MKKSLFSLFCICLLVACAKDSHYPQEYYDFDLPTYPNAVGFGVSQVKTISSDGDIEIKMLVKTTDPVSKIKSFFEGEMKKRGYDNNNSGMMKQLQDQGAPIDETNYYHGFFQNMGKVFTVTVVDNSPSDTIPVNITFIGSNN